MFSPLIVIYLFLAGSGCGAFVAAVFLSWRARTSSALTRSFEPVALYALILPCAMVVVGVTCLVLDLGRPELALAVLANPAGSVLSLGAWALVVFAGSVMVLIACNTKALRLGGAVLRAIKALGCVVAIVVMVYSGLFLSTIATLPFLASPLVPVLFVCSSLSCGAAVLLVLVPLYDADPHPLFREIVRIDAALLVLEVLALSALMAWAAHDALSSAAAYRLLSGDLAPAFWGGLAGAGIVVPFALEALLRSPDAPACAVLGILLLVGGFFLRYCLCVAPFTGPIVSYL